MPSVEERMAYREGRVEEHSRGFGGLRELRVHLDQRLTGRIDALDQKVDRFCDELAGRIEALAQRAAKQFVWLVGIPVTVLVAVIAAVLAR